MGITIWQNLADHAETIARRAFAGIDTLEAWERERSHRREEYLRAIGLFPLPARCAPGTRDGGAFAGPGFRARRIGFQLLPDCWSSAAIYYPDPAPAEPAPGVLYVCGHADIGTWHYQYHPVMWARRGYVCLVLDTIEQNDNPGEHHFFLLNRHEAWLSLGYASLGGEVLNSMRALDLLADDPLVDPARLGVTGVSGGGSLSFHLAVADERIRAVSTLCGVTTPFDTVVNRHYNCDCFHPLNIFRRDTAEHAALIAPRALQFCFADQDGLFNPEESRALATRTAHVYRLYGQPGNCRLVTCPGLHGDHPEFDEATSRWFDRHLAGAERPLVARGGRELPERVTGGFQGRPPAPDLLGQLPRLVAPRGALGLPADAGGWPTVRRDALAALRREVPGLFAPPETVTPLACCGDWRWREDARASNVRAHRGRVEGVDIWLETAIDPASPAPVILGLADPGELFRSPRARLYLARGSGAAACDTAALEPRLAGGNFRTVAAPDCAPGSRFRDAEHELVRAMAFTTGQTPVMVTVQDLGVAVDYLLGLAEMRGRRLFIYGRGEFGVAALYRALLDERVAGVIAERIPASHLDGAPVTGILRAFDLPQAVGLLAPRPVALVNPGRRLSPRDWTWTARAYERLGQADRFLLTADLGRAVAHACAGDGQAATREETA